jgi:hypothetical protein
MPKTEFGMRAKVWLYAGAGGWHFVTLPKKPASEIRSLFGALRGGWGSLPVIATVGNTSWKTSIFPDKESGSYVLPLKAEIRKNEGLTAGRVIAFSVRIRA